MVLEDQLLPEIITVRFEKFSINFIYSIIQCYFNSGPPYLGAQYGGFYPAPQLAIPANTTGVTPPPATSSSSYEQFETLKTTAEPPEIVAPVFPVRSSEEEAGSTTGTSEFSGLVSYFSSQHDDLET